MQPDDVLRGLPGYPYTAWLLVVVLFVAYVAKTIRERPQKQSKTNASLGKRLQHVEQLVRLAEVRRLQTEHELGRRGLRLPYWPGDPPPPDYDVQVVDDQDDDQGDDARTEAQRIPVPPIPTYSRHHRRTAP